MDNDDDAPLTEEHVKAMKQHTYFGLLLSTAAQVIGAGGAHPDQAVRQAVQLIKDCALEAGMPLKDILP